MHCSACGEEISAASSYCRHCGAAVTPQSDDDWGSESDEWGSTESGDRSSESTPDAATVPTADYEPNPESVTPSSSDSTTMAAITHLLGLITWIIGPAIVMVTSDDPFVLENAKTALNWQISYTIYMVVSFVLMVVLVGFLTAMLLPLLDLVLCIVAAVKAADGETWSYPATIDFF